MKRNFLRAAVFMFFCINIVLIGFLIQKSDIIEETSFFPDKKARPEIEYLQASALQSFGELSKYFSDLAKKKGGAYAYEILKAAPVPPGTDMHLLGHIVGDVLYGQEGLDGIKVCTHDFRNACSHTIVVGLLLEQGESAFPQIVETCYQAPGGSGAYTMCFHGLGHGVLAYTAYDLEKAVELCEKTGTPEYGYEEASQCISGTIMEILSGVHDQEAWARQYKKYLKEDDPLYPCSAQFIPEHARYLCYVYLTPHLFEAAGASLANPTPYDYKKAFPFCNEIPISDMNNRDACYGGFGKEFVVLAQDRDIRNVDAMTDEQMGNVYKWCLLADNKDGVISCIEHATNSLYWGGENNRGTAIRFCRLLRSADHQEACFINLIGAVQTYIRDPDYKKEFCEELPDSYRGKCQQHLL